MADLWTFTLKNGTVLRYTNADIKLKLSGNTFTCGDVLVEGGAVRTTRGLQVDETDLTCYPSPGSTVGSVPFLRAVREGMFDRSTVQKQRVFMPTWGDTSAGAVTLFLGEVSDTQSSRTTAVLKCKNAINLLNIYMPRRQYQASCSWVFGDSNCTISRAGLTVTSAVASGSSGSTINCSLTQASGFFNSGVVKFTSGLNSGLSMTVKSWAVGVATLVAPFPNPLVVGDAFSITPGCDKTLSTCTNTYANAINFGGQPYVPVPETSF